MADDGDGTPAELREPRDERFVVAKAAVPVQLHKIGEHQVDPVESVRPLRVAGNLRALPGAQVRVKLAAQFEHFPFQALDFGFALFRGSEAAELLDVFFQALDFALAIDRRDSLFIFLRSAHYATL